MSLQAPLWRAIAVFRFASLAYAAGLVAWSRADYLHPAWAWGVVTGMGGWTAVTTVAYARPGARSRFLLAADLAVTVAALLSTAAVQQPLSIAAGVMPVTATWVGGPVLAWAVAGGMGPGAAAAAVLGGCDLAMRYQLRPGLDWNPAVNGAVLLLLAGIVVGYMSGLARRAEQALQRATEIEAASRERERLARGIHDSVLQVLALVQRRGAEAGGEAAEIGRLAGQQETALRALIAADGGAASPAGEQDLRSLLARHANAGVSVVTPAEPVLLPGRAAREAAAAVRAALDNVRRHGGETARAWVLIDDEGTGVSVTVRDDGPGIPEGRLAEAAAEGRFGISQSICGRLRDLGGSAAIVSSPGTGTEVRLRIPRSGSKLPA